MYIYCYPLFGTAATKNTFVNEHGHGVEYKHPAQIKNGAVLVLLHIAAAAGIPFVLATLVQVNPGAKHTHIHAASPVSWRAIYGGVGGRVQGQACIGLLALALVIAMEFRMFCVHRCQP